MQAIRTKYVLKTFIY